MGEFENFETWCLCEHPELLFHLSGRIFILLVVQLGLCHFLHHLEDHVFSNGCKDVKEPLLQPNDFSLGYFVRLLGNFCPVHGDVKRRYGP